MTDESVTDTASDAKVEPKKIELNNFSSQITTQHVTSNLIIIKKNLSYVVENSNVKTNAVPATITRHELLDVFEKIFVKVF